MGAVSSICSRKETARKPETGKAEYMNLKAAEQQTLVPEKRQESGGGCGKCCCCAFFCLIFLYLAAVGGSAYLIITKFATLQEDWMQPTVDKEGKLLTPNNLTFFEFWPGCERGPKTGADFDKCGGSCFNSSLPIAMDFYNKENSYFAVNFPSRPGADGQAVVNLTGWWLPNPKDPTAPIVVYAHGMSGSANQMRVQTVAYLLRKVGYSVLLPNFRDHGSSGSSDSDASKKHITWGWAYHLDLLGAYDWAVTTQAGGDATKVGVGGISMGGFAAAIATGMENRIQGIWLDGAVYDPYESVIIGQLGKFLGPLAPALALPAWKLTEKIVGVELRKHLPEKDVPKRNTSFHYALVVNAQDDLAAHGKEEYPKLFNAHQGVEQTSFYVDSTCNGEPHCTTVYQYPTEYEQKLKTFWDCALKNIGCVVVAAPVTSNITVAPNVTASNVSNAIAAPASNVTAAPNVTAASNVTATNATTNASASRRLRSVIV